MRRFMAAICVLFSLLSITSPSVIAASSARAAGEIIAGSPALFTIPGKINALIPLSNGKMLTGGSFISVGGQPAPRSLAIINSDGSLDPSFQVDPSLQVGEVNAAALQPDGKIVIVGWFHVLPDTFTYYYLRLNANGTLDDGFYKYAILAAQVYSVYIDGSNILLGGNFTNPVPRIARLDQTGHIDASFNVGTGPNGAVRGIARQSSGKYIITGEFSTFNDVAQAGLARLNTSGSLDTAFLPGGSIGGRTVAVLKGVSLDTVVVGSEDICNISRNIFAWYTPDGILKSTPAVDPNMFQSIKTLLPLPDGGFLVGGWRSPVCIGSSPTSHEGQVWRYGSDGTYQTMTSFGNESDVFALGLRSDGKVLVGGQGRPATVDQIGIFDGLALLDLANNGLEKVGTFHPLVGDEAEFYDLSTYADGRLLVAGNFWYVNGRPLFGLARLLANGSLDTAFAPFANRPGGWSTAALALPDDRAVAGFGSNELHLIGANGDLTNLSAYNNYDRVSTIVRQSDGKILVGSDFGRGVRRMKADFSGEDTTFQGGDAYGNVYDLAVLPDDRIYVAGDFSKYDNVTYPGLVRLQNNGLIDSSFVPPVFLDDVGNAGTLYGVTTLSTGEVLVGGYFQKVADVDHPALVRLNTGGSLDATFTLPGNFHTVRTICVQGDSSIWAGGIEATNARNPLIRLLSANGSVDSTYDSSLQAAHGNFSVEKGKVNVILCNAGGLNWAGGRFSLSDNLPIYGLARFIQVNSRVFLPLIMR